MTSIILNKQNYNIRNHKIMAPGSKSETIRLIIGAFLCNDYSYINQVSLCDDVLKTIEVTRKLGAIIDIKKNDENNNFHNLKIKGIDINQSKSEEVTLDIGSSATLFRIIAPIALMLSKKVIVYANEDFWNRPNEEIKKYLDIEIKKGYAILSNLKIKKEMEVDGSVSSQYASGLLFALSLLNEQSTLKVTNLESKEYLIMTMEVMKKFGINVLNQGEYYQILSNRYQNIKTKVNGDYSQASFFLTLGAFLGDLEIKNLQTSHQADEVILDLLKKMGGKVTIDVDSIKIEKSNLKWIDNINVQECIDLAPIIFVIAGILNDDCKIYGTKRLAYKESNRTKALQEEFQKIGIDIEIEENLCFIKKHGLLNEKIVFNSHNDHRICMALSILSIILNINCKIEGIDCVDKSFPLFFNTLKELGIKYEIIRE